MIRGNADKLRERGGRGTIIIVVMSAVIILLVAWFAPTLSAASLNALFRWRGSLKAPDDLVILAIDDESLQQIGSWPWPREIMADLIDRLSADTPRAIGLDVIYAEPSAPDGDRRLATALRESRQVILPVQIYESSAGEVEWLNPAPIFAESSRGAGHVHITPDVDGMVRGLQLRKADDRGQSRWAFALEVLRVAESIPAGDFDEQAGRLRFGSHHLPVREDSILPEIPGVTIIRANEMAINYVGPAGSFRYLSAADLFAGRLPRGTFTNRIVLVGATAQSLGDTRIAPFMHYGEREGGLQMPGVEIHANIINTIRAGIAARPLSDGRALLLSLLVLLGAVFVIRRFDGWLQVSLLGGLLLTVLLGSYLAFSRLAILPPLIQMLTGFGVAIPLLLSRALTASRELDLKLAALVDGQQGLLPPTTARFPDSPDDHRRSAGGIELPRSLSQKIREVDSLTVRLLARMSFINRVLSSMGEGVLVSDLAGRLVYVNRSAERLMRRGQGGLIGRLVGEIISESSPLASPAIEAAINEAVVGRSSQLEVELRPPEPGYYALAISGLVADDGDSSEIIGVIIILSDVTRRHQLDRMKTETLQLVSHELRTPLSSIHSLSDTLLRLPVPPAEAREIIATIHGEALRLGETINHYLDLTRLESGAHPLSLTTIDAEELIREAIRPLSVAAAERRILITHRVEPSLPPLCVDAALISQALVNLLSNAIKYSPQQTEVTIIAESRPDSIIISVTDQGFGIPEEAHDLVFHKFYRLSRDTTSGVVGTGLGLPIVREIVERHGGGISLASLPGGGSAFTLHLPIHRLPAI